MNYETAIENELANWPDATVKFSKGAKHNRATVTFRGSSRFIVYPMSGSDSRRGVANCIADVRAELKALGASRVVQKRNVVREKGSSKTRVYRDNLQHAEKALVKVNPFDALKDVVIAPPPPVKSSWLEKILKRVKEIWS